MANDNKFRNQIKRGFPGGFFLFLLAAVVIMLAIQTFTSDRIAKVSFSHQVEHLINLNLTVPEENRKIAQNENLVTFSGKFRDALLEESRDRYHYLELLNHNHELSVGQNSWLQDLDRAKKNVEDASALFLQLSGQPLPRGGYVVVGALYDTPGRENSIVIRISPIANRVVCR